MCRSAYPRDKVESIRSQDLRRLRDVLSDASSVPRTALGLAPCVIDGLAPIVGCDVAAVAAPAGSVASDPAIAVSRRSDEFEALVGEHPILRWRGRTDSWGAVTFDDVIERRELERSAVYNDLFLPFAWCETVSARVDAVDRFDFSFGRTHRPFRERERILVDLARTFFQAILTEPAGSRTLAPLTGRQTEVLELVAIGMTNAEIAERLVIAPGTVKRHLDLIYERLGVGNRTAAARFLDGR